MKIICKTTRSDKTKTSGARFLKSCVLATISLVTLFCLIPLANADPGEGGVKGQQVEAAQQLIKRVTPSIAGQFVLESIPSANGKDVYELESIGDKIVLRGNNGVSLASAYNRYLTDYCKCLYSLWGDQISLPKTLPTVPQKIRQVTPRQLRHFFNYCTFNYSGTWWDWNQWQKIIDFLAMNGINMPLNIVGVESVWYQTLIELGLSDQEAREFLPAPVYLNWQWMGNLEGTGGPLPKSWIDGHAKLGRQIMEREQSLGMTPILHGFTGVVPRIFKTKFPNARIDMKPGWARDSFLGTATMDPLDPLFSKISKVYLNQLVRQFGTSHYYMSDPFHESKPPVEGDEYLGKVAHAIEESLLSVDPDAVWVTQDWSFRPAIIKALGMDRIIIMSVNGSKCGQYRDWGYRYTIGQLNSFGGETHLHGVIGREAGNGLVQEMKRFTNCVGSGNWMEGLENAPAYYHFVLGLNWESGPVDAAPRLDEYYQERYGGITDNIRSMNRLLLDSVYQRGGHGFSSVLAARPAVFPIKSSPVKEIEVNKSALDKEVQAWKLMLQDREKFKNSKGYQYDVVDLGRQILGTLAVYYQRDTAIYLHRKDPVGLHKARERFLGLADDLDTLMGTCDNFLLGKSLAEARRWGATPQESDYYAKYATTLITLWGQDNTNYYAPNWQDYAGREWNGLIENYYKKRWEMFYDEVEARLPKGEVFEDVMRDKWARPLTVADKSGFYGKLYKFESTFGENLPPMSSVSQGDAAATAWRLLNKYEADLAALPAESPILSKLFEPTTYNSVAWTSGSQQSVKIKDDVLQKVLAAGPYFKY